MSEQRRGGPKCLGVRRDGTPCRAPIAGASGYCFTHDPTRAQDRTDAHRKGGRNSGATARLRGLCPPRLVGVFEQLETALTGLQEGTVDPRVATAMAAVSRAMVAVLTGGELEQRVRSIEEGQRHGE